MPRLVLGTLLRASVRWPLPSHAAAPLAAGGLLRSVTVSPACGRDTESPWREKEGLTAQRAHARKPQAHGRSVRTDPELTMLMPQR